MKVELHPTKDIYNKFQAYLIQRQLPTILLLLMKQHPSSLLLKVFQKVINCMKINSSSLKARVDTYSLEGNLLLDLPKNP